MNDVIKCTRCNKKIKTDPVFLELDMRTDSFTSEAVPGEFSQGGFPFGRDCADIEIARHTAVKP